MRVNARLDENSSQKLSYLERETGWGVSEIIRKAIQTYYRDFRREKVEPKSALERSGFIACADGPRESLRDLQNRASRSRVQAWSSLTLGSGSPSRIEPTCTTSAHAKGWSRSKNRSSRRGRS